MAATLEREVWSEEAACRLDDVFGGEDNKNAWGRENCAQCAKYSGFMSEFGMFNDSPHEPECEIADALNLCFWTGEPLHADIYRRAGGFLRLQAHHSATLIPCREYEHPLDWWRRKKLAEQYGSQDGLPL